MEDRTGALENIKMSANKLVSKVSGKRILIVGGTGFIGKSLVSACVDYGLICTVLSLNKIPKEEKLKHVEYLNADLTDAEWLKKALSKKKFEYIVNLSGYVDHSMLFSGGKKVIDTHFNGLINLLEALDRSIVERLVQVGSSDEYGNISAPQDETMRENPISPYSLAKVCSTHMLQMLHSTENFPAVILRLFLVYGPRQAENRFLPQVIHGCLNDNEFSVSAGGQLRDFCYIDDVIDGIILSLTKEEAIGKVFNMASGSPISIRDMVSDVVGIVGMGKPKYGDIAYRANENMALYADTTYTSQVLGWTAKVGLKEGLKSVINSYKADKYGVS